MVISRKLIMADYFGGSKKQLVIFGLGSGLAFTPQAMMVPRQYTWSDIPMIIG